MARTVVLGLALTLGLAMAPSGAAESEDRDVWARELVRRGVDPDVAVYPFNPSLEMEAWAEEVLQEHPDSTPIWRLTALQTALFDSDFDFRYDASLTLAAEQAFAARRGNCMSFTSLFVTLARMSGVEAFLMSVQRPPEVDRLDDLVVVNRHVVAAYLESPGTYRIFDFYLRSATSYMGQRRLDDVVATAMFHANLGGDAIRAGDLDLAVRHLGIATTLAPDWAPGWINLGVARSRRGDPDGAFEAYRSALEADPRDASALTNIAAIYRDQGLVKEAENALRAAAHQTNNPFTLIAAADAEMLAGKLKTAGKYLRRARRWYPDEPEVRLAMARLATHLGDPARAARYQQKAAELARTKKE